MRNPRARQRGFSNEMFDVGAPQLKLTFGGVTFSNTTVPIEIRGVPLFKVDSPEIPGAPFRLTGNFHDASGAVSLEVIQNEWRPYATNWDVEVIGGVITIRQAPGRFALELRTVPPDHLIVQRLEMLANGYRFSGTPDRLLATMPNGSDMDFTGCIVDGCQVGLSLG